MERKLRENRVCEMRGSGCDSIITNKGSLIGWSNEICTDAGESLSKAKVVTRDAMKYDSVRKSPNEKCVHLARLFNDRMIWHPGLHFVATGWELLTKDHRLPVKDFPLLLTISFN